MEIRLSIQKTAEIMNVNEDTVRRLIARGELAAARVGRQYRIDPAVVRKMLAASSGSLKHSVFAPGAVLQ